MRRGKNRGTGGLEYGSPESRRDRRGKPEGSRAQAFEQRPAPAGSAPVRERPVRVKDKEWQEPCHFSCIPYGARPVDVYDPAGTTVPNSGGPV